ncbi:hypothetical protein GGS23DRAFT_573580 [Durotheca rogersii]|uniref:uncharacterized protein n=1 Tax=Durotheca rogersii TaxID=419775 RepID=UPI0022207C35|nr:uncharacterized protein GGS23DRAFT_573580 [Durotheca rogersii]KAI5862287.1 hypothetical protein GGS23DRAFT_573580 [Durotheca rogersii]
MVNLANLALVYPGLLLVAAGFAIYVQVTSSTLALPLATGTTVLAILLPFFAAGNLFLTSAARRVPVGARTGSSSSSPSQSLPRSLASLAALVQFLPAALQLLQGVLTVVVATLAAERVTPGRTLGCGLEGNWQRMWSANDGQDIERIQNAFNCCGLRSPVDRAWPKRGEIPCTKLYNRANSCLAPWQESAQRAAGFELTIALVLGLFQLVHLVLFRLRRANGGGSGAEYRRKFDSVATNPRGRLIEDGTDDEEASTGAERGGDEPGVGRREHRALEEGPSRPRLEPSNLGSEQNDWA